jgi:hypothetical protein
MMSDLKMAEYHPRIARLHMRPMSLAESGESTGGVSFGKHFEGEFALSRNKTGIMDVARWCCRSPRSGHNK